MKLVATKYEIVGVAYTIEKRGENSWALCDGVGQVLSRSGKWTYEMSPSNRTDAFIRTHRFESPTSAAAALEKKLKEKTERR